MDINNIYEMLDRFEHSTVGELELDMNGVHLRLKKASASMAALQTGSVPTRTEEANATVGQQSGNMNAAVGQQSGNPAENAAVSEQTHDAALHPVKAPLVGTYYQAASPNADPYVRIGQEIHKGDVIGIIEAMKLMNEVVADQDGIVAEILAEDGSMVEYDQILITIR